MSSILDALRELEGTKPSSQRSRAAWAVEEAEERSPLRRAAELLGIVAFGLALGAVAFGLFLWLGGGDGQRPDTPVANTAPSAARQAAPAPTTPPMLAPAAPAPPVPAWLTRMGPPRGRVEGGDDGKSAPAAETSVAPRATGLSLIRLHYTESRGERSATLRIDGSPLVLHEGDTAQGIELQLVTPTGAYVRRGGEVLMLEQSR